MKHSNSLNNGSRANVAKSEVETNRLSIFTIRFSLAIATSLAVFTVFHGVVTFEQPLKKTLNPLDVIYPSNIPNPFLGNNFADPMDPSYDSILASAKIYEERIAAIRREEKILGLYGAKNEEINDIILDVRKTKLKERLNQHPDLHASNFYLLFPKKTIKWKSYKLIGSLHQILEVQPNKNKDKVNGLEEYVLRTKKEVLVPNLVRISRP